MYGALTSKIAKKVFHIRSIWLKLNFYKTHFKPRYKHKHNNVLEYCTTFRSTFNIYRIYLNFIISSSNWKINYFFPPPITQKNMIKLMLNNFKISHVIPSFIALHITLSQANFSYQKFTFNTKCNLPSKPN